MRKIIPILIMILFFAAPVTANAEQVEILDHHIEWLESNKDFANYCWHTDIWSSTACTKRIALKIDLYDEKGNVLDTIYPSVYIEGRQKQHFSGNASINCDASQIKDSRVVIDDVLEISR